MPRAGHLHGAGIAKGDCLTRVSFPSTLPELDIYTALASWTERPGNFLLADSAAMDLAAYLVTSLDHAGWMLSDLGRELVHVFVTCDALQSDQVMHLLLTEVT